jgi:hypothetical protein
LDLATLSRQRDLLDLLPREEVRERERERERERKKKEKEIISHSLSLSSPPKGQKDNGRNKTPLLITLYIINLYFKLYYLY